MTHYVRPQVQSGPHRPEDAVSLAGGALWFTHAVVQSRDAADKCVPLQDIPPDVLARLTAPRAALAGMDMARSNVMGILNVTPDSFSDGGKHAAPAIAVAAGMRMVDEGADILDVGGESTRPGALTVPVEAEIARIEPVIRALRHNSDVAISIDTRKTAVAGVALSSGAGLVNDVSGFTFDEGLAPMVAARAMPVCVMHAQGDPQTMQIDPKYGNVLLDVYDFLESQVVYLESLGLPRDQIAVDPGIGFGKTAQHNLKLLSGLALFHGLGCPILLGASRKGFIGKVGRTADPADRLGGSVSVALAAAARGAQILRVHDVKETVQALRLWRAIDLGQCDEGSANGA